MYCDDGAGWRRLSCWPRCQWPVTGTRSPAPPELPAELGRLLWQPVQSVALSGCHSAAAGTVTSDGLTYASSPDRACSRCSARSVCYFADEESCGPSDVLRVEQEIDARCPGTALQLLSMTVSSASATCSQSSTARDWRTKSTHFKLPHINAGSTSPKRCMPAKSAYTALAARRVWLQTSGGRGVAGAAREVELLAPSRSGGRAWTLERHHGGGRSTSK
jgi:hypothetical protein